MATQSRTLSPLQLRLLDAFRDVPTAYLTGGAALGHFYLGHRRSYDLDWFTPNREDLDRMSAVLADFCRASGIALEEQQRYPGFRRLRASDSSGETLVDLVHEPVPQTKPVAEKPRHDGVIYDAIEDLVANKLGAVLGRGETKDLVDLFHLSAAGHDPLDALQDACNRDAGMDPATLAWVLKSVPTDLSGLLQVKKIEPAELAAFRDALAARLQALAWPAEPGPAGD